MELLCKVLLFCFPSGRLGARRLGWLGLLLVLGGFATAVWLHLHAVAAGSDSSGYMNHARLLGEGRLYEVPERVPGLPLSKTAPFQYSPLGFRPLGAADVLVPTYPFGIPLLIVLTAKLSGWASAPDLLIGGHALLGLWLLYLFGRETGLHRRYALAAVLLLALSPLYAHYSAHLMSDVPAMVWVLLAAYGALRAGRSGPWAYLSGFAFAVSVFIRPTNVLILPTLLLLQGLGVGVCLRFILAGLPWGGVYLFLNHHEYGSAFASGYLGAETLFGAGNVVPTLGHYLRWLPLLFSPLVWLCLLLPLLVRGRGRLVWSLLLWLLGYLGFYATYYHTHETWWYLRFVLPAVPALLVGALLVLQEAEGMLGARPWRHALVLLAVVSAWIPFQQGRKLGAWNVGQGELVYKEVTDWAAEHLPKQSFIVCMQCSGAFKYYTRLPLVRWDMGEPDELAALQQALGRSERPVYAVLFPFEEEDCRRRLPGDWQLVHKIRHVSVWKLR